MAKHTKLLLTGVLLLAVGGAVIASNMGFKLVPNLNQASKTFTISLPNNNNYATASSVFDDINLSGCTANKIERIVPSAGAKARQIWDGTGTDFTIAKGDGYLLEVAASCTTWVVVGSHDPAFQMNFQANKETLTSVPYHTTALTANDLFTSIPSCTKVERIVPSAGGKAREIWDGTGTDFAVTIGEAYLVATSAVSTWTPAHY